jgi:hypothetical protein
MPKEMAGSNFVKNAGGGMHMLHQPVGYGCTGYPAPLRLEAVYGYQAHN